MLLKVNQLDELHAPECYHRCWADCLEMVLLCPWPALNVVLGCPRKHPDEYSHPGRAVVTYRAVISPCRCLSTVSFEQWKF